MHQLEFHGVVDFRCAWRRDPGDKVVIDAELLTRDGRRLLVPFMVDTGAPWCVIDPELMAEIEGDAEGDSEIGWRGQRGAGQLRRVPLYFGQTEGQRVKIEATVLVPQLAPGDHGPFPNFLGLSALNRLRWAIEPGATRFYFAGLS